MSKILLFIVFGVAFGVIFWLYSNTHMKEVHVSVTGGVLGSKYYQIENENKDEESLSFDLIDPECAPEARLTQILYGYHIMLDTRQHTPLYSGNSIDCNCCHFNAGNTLGGKNRGISLVGVTAVYPRFSKRDNSEISLSERINNCYMRSLNGKPLPKNSLEMEAILAYLEWISQEVLTSTKFPWLGLDPITSDHVPDIIAGEKVYEACCTLCHGTHGEGRIGTPPLWGDNSFNDGAGMNKLELLSSFVLQNMPHGQPYLTPDQALDVAAYLISRPRPHFIKPK